MLKEMLEKRAEHLNKLLEGRFTLSYAYKTINSGILEGYKLDPGNTNILPVIYYDEAWEQMSDAELITYFIKVFEETNTKADLSTFLNKEYLMQHVMPMLMELQNKRFVEQERFLYEERDGFLVLFYCPINPAEFSLGPDNVLTLRITHMLLEHLDIERNEIMKTAYDNLESSTKLEVHRLPGKELLTQVTTTYYNYGAAAILSSRIKRRLKKLYDGSFYVLPLSVNEIMAVPRSTRNPSGLFRDFMRICPDRDKLTEKIYIFEDDVLRIMG